MTHADPDTCYRAVQSRDTRFDGWFFVAVTSTGIYCRPSCPSRTPKRENTRFFQTAAAAQTQGFRPCLRCRPDTTPGSPEWDVRGDVTARVMRLIADGVVDREGVAGLARRVGYSSRHLNRVLTEEVGAGALALARAQRAQTARTLLECGDLPIGHVAFAAGFSSVRQFNDTIRAVFGCTPSDVRKAVQRRCRRPRYGSDIVLRLAHRRPFDPAWSLRFLGTRALAGVESQAGTPEAPRYRRTLMLPHCRGHVELLAEGGEVSCRLHLPDMRDLTAAVRRCRHLLDLDADPTAVADHLGTDPVLGPAVRRQPGLRIPRGVDGFEIAARTVIGQQVSVAGARRTAAKIVDDMGGRPESPPGWPDRTFPDAAVLAAADPASLGMPRTRGAALVALAHKVDKGELDLGPGADRAATAARLLAIDGIGPWTASLVALRALGDPDAFCAGDLGVRRGLARLGADPDQVVTQRWSPWRAYAMAHIWDAASAPEPKR
ncbi:MAG: helix-turn-helix domain-containing protein [Acidimicrobiia bacterium]|nr:helix-turn-helix domain-containing protein [Acidimicrobiia bacterium]